MTTSSIDHIPRLAEWLAASDIDELELTGPQGRVLLRRSSASGEVSMLEPDEEPADVAPLADLSVVSPGIGTFLRAHPLHEHPLTEAGAGVEAGQALGLLQVGSLLVAVPAPRSGTIRAILAEDGALTGFGDPLFQLSPYE